MKITKSKPEKVISEAIEAYEEFIKPTYGPAGKKTLIVRNEFDQEAVDDGKRTAEAFEIEDEFKQAVIQHIQEATRRGKDGTTTSGLIMCGAVKEAYKDLDNELANIDYHGVALDLEIGLQEALKQLKSRPVKTKEELYKVAYNSYKNTEIAKLIAETVYEVGKDGVVAIEDSHTTSTTCEKVNGLELQKGYVSPYFINTDDKERVVLQSPDILLINKRIESLIEILPLITEGNPNNPAQRKFISPNLVIIAESFGEDVVHKLIGHRVMGNVNPLLIEIPHSSNKLEKLKDIAVVVGAKVVDDKSEITLKNATKEVFGSADSVTASKDKTKIINGKGKKSDIKAYLEGLKSIEPKNPSEKDSQTKRIAEILGGIAVIKVGAYTETAIKGMKTKIENAIDSTQMAYRSGVVEGAGKALLNIKTSSPVLNEALKNPRRVLEENGAKYLDENTTDPTEVVTTALTTGVSMAIGLLQLGGISAVKRKRDEWGNVI